MGKNKANTDGTAPLPVAEPGPVLKNLPLSSVQPHPEFNPREVLGDITELVDLIRQNGLISPITVCPASPGSDSYFVVAGARRHAAVTKLGHDTIAAVVRADLTIQSPEALALAMAENDNEGRTALAPLEQAKAYRRLYDMVDGRSDVEKHKAIARMLGRRSAGAHQNIRVTLRLLDAPERIQSMLADGSLSKFAAITISELPEEVRAAVAARVGPQSSESDVRRLAQEVAREASAGVTTAPDGQVSIDGQPAEVDLADEGEGDVPAAAAPADPPARSAPRPHPTTTAGARADILLWRSKGETNDMLAELADEIVASDGQPTQHSHVFALRNRLVTLVWVTGACDEISIDDPDFVIVQARLLEAARNRAGG